MPLAYPADPSLIPIERPRCPKCKAPMMLARIEHGPAVSDLADLRMSQVRTRPKGADRRPIKSEKAGWLNSELRPPE